ncbi:hypothetical protein M3J09_008430 [Ascochyta lentis]
MDIREGGGRCRMCRPAPPPRLSLEQNARHPRSWRSVRCNSFNHSHSTHFYRHSKTNMAGACALGRQLLSLTYST